MPLSQDATLLRIFLGESDRSGGRASSGRASGGRASGGRTSGGPLYEAIVQLAREQKLAGATVLRGPMGFGRTSVLHTAKILRLSEDLPIIIEIVDRRDKIDAFLPLLEPMMNGGLITLEKVEVIRYQAGRPPTEE